MTDDPHRRSTAFATVVVIAGAGGLCWMAATATARFIEQRSLQDVSIALNAGGHDWTEVATDGLQVQLSGTAPNEVQRFRAMTQVAAIVDPTRIVDEMQVAVPDAITPPDFSVELLRNDEGISLIGLVPAQTDRLAVVRTLQSETAAPQVVDLLEAADFPTPDGWTEAMEFGLRAAQIARRAKISVTPGIVTINAITDSAAEKARLETALRRSKPTDLVLISEISAPRPVIAPFTLRFVMDDDGPRFDACSTDTEEGRDLILSAARAAGLAGPAGCTIGLGSPSPEWSEAAAQSIAAVAEIGAGTVTLSDADIALFAPTSIPRDIFDAAAGRLEQGLPPVFSLQAELEQAPDADAGPAEFIASVSTDQTLYMRGRITDERMREAVDSFAGSRFDQVESTLRTDDTVPGGWTVRVIAALEAVATLKNGAAIVTPDLVRITGTSGNRDASGQAASSLSQRLGAGAHYELAIRYDERLDPLLGLPDGDECVAQLNMIMSESVIGFEPNKSVIAGDPAETLGRLTEAMADCTVFQIELGGHTDSQGSEGFNADLSRARAQAVLTAMTEAGIDSTNLTARGYGESQPIASNETEEGREANRRIEFRLLSEAPVRREPLPQPVVVSGITDPQAPAREDDPETAADSDTDAETETESVASAAQADSQTDAEEATGEPGPGGMGGPDLVMPVGPSVQAPAVVGVAEAFVSPAESGLDADDENARLPVLTPDADTPRPEPRPAGETIADE